MIRRLAILGSTGSIGTQALDVAARHADRFQVVALIAGHNRQRLFEQVRAFRPRLAGLAEFLKPEDIPEDLRFCDWVFGEEALCAAASCECDDVLVSVVGMRGLPSVLCAFEHHKRVLLANKEALVAGGHLVMEAAAREGEHSLLPVDSEHSAIFQCLQAAGGNPFTKIELTCSGGPFRACTREEIRAAVRSRALKHPNWVMGQKITIDSATLFNKALEMIEAKWLFSAAPEQIEVVIHPQSVIHSGVEFADGAILAQLGTPDMRLPILYAMSYPQRLPTGGAPLDLFALNGLTFERPDEKRFPSVRLSRECMQSGGAAGCILNAANETAVFHLLKVADEKEFPLGRVFDTVEETLQRVGSMPADTLEQVMEADALARRVARELIEKT